MGPPCLPALKYLNRNSVQSSEGAKSFSLEEESNGFRIPQVIEYRLHVLFHAQRPSLERERSIACQVPGVDERERLSGRAY